MVGRVAAGALCALAVGVGLAGARTLGVPTYSHDVGRYATAEISPVDAERGPDGNWYVMDEGQECVKVYAPDLRTVVRTLFTCSVGGSDATHVRRARGIGIDQSSGVIWIADTVNQRVLAVDPTGRLLVSTTAPTAPSGPFKDPADVAVDGQGNAYVVDERSRIVELSRSGAFVAEFGSPGNGRGQLQKPMSIAYSPAGSKAGQGNLYVSDARNYRLDEFTTGGRFVRILGGEGIGLGQLTKDVRGIAVDAEGVVYAADVGGNRIVRFAADGSPLPSLGSGLPYGGSGPTSLFYGARGLFLAGSSLAVCDMWNYRVLLWSPDGSHLGQIGGTPPPPDGHMDPHGLALDAAGNLYVSDYWHQWIQVFAPNGRLLARWGQGRGADPGTLNLPGGIAVDNVRGYLYIANREQHVVDRWKLADGSFDARFKLPGANAAWPRAVAVDQASGLVYAADERNDRVDVESASGDLVRTLDSYGHDARPLGSPHAVAVDAVGRIYVADHTNSAVHVYAPDGTWLRSFPVADPPAGIAVAAGVVYVLASASTVSEYTPNGSLLLTWGSRGHRQDQLYEPYVGIVVDPTGAITIADTDNHRVKVFVP